MIHIGLYCKFLYFLFKPTHIQNVYSRDKFEACTCHRLWVHTGQQSECCKIYFYIPVTDQQSLNYGSMFKAFPIVGDHRPDQWFWFQERPYAKLPTSYSMAKLFKLQYWKEIKSVANNYTCVKVATFLCYSFCNIDISVY